MGTASLRGLLQDVRSGATVTDIEDPTDEQVRMCATLLFAADAVLVGDQDTFEDALRWSETIFAVTDSNPLWANGGHCGDCTKQPLTCNRCLTERYQAEARGRWDN